MSNVSRLRTLSILIAVACLATAYLLAGYWTILPVLAAMAVPWLLFGRFSASRRASFLLIAFVGLSLVGVVLKLSIMLLIPGIIAALAAWDLASFAEILSTAISADHGQRLWRQHLQALVVALALGLILALAAALSSISLPFAVVALIALVLVAALVEAVQRLRSTGG